MFELRSFAAPALEREDVHVWKARMGVHRAEETALRSLLDADETARADRFHHRDDRTRFIIAHGLLRRLLASYLAVAPRAVRFTTGTNGKPFVAPLASGAAVEFNLSHSDEVMVVAIAREPVGVDVERWSEAFDYDALAATVFSAHEQRALASVPAAAKRAAFFAGWTRKEAYIKATGLGLAEGLAYFDVSLDPDASAPLLADRRFPAAAHRWRMRNVPVDPGYSASVVSARAASRLAFLGVPAGVTWRYA